MINIMRQISMANKLIAIFTILFICGCDQIIDVTKEELEKGTMDGVVRCIEENQNKKDLIGEKYIRNECIQKNSIFSQSQFFELGLDNCSASLSFSKEKYALYSRNGTCINQSNNFITSLTLEIFIRNIPEDIERDGLWNYTVEFEDILVPPGIQVPIDMSENISSLAELNLDDPLIFCSDLDDSSEICKGFALVNIGYLKSGI